MRDGGRIHAAICVLDATIARARPVRDALREWGRSARYAGSADRAFVSGLVLDALRRRAWLASGMGAESPRALTFAALVHVWTWKLERLEAALGDDHAPEPLSAGEKTSLLMPLPPGGTLAVHIDGNFPQWMTASLTRVFGMNTSEEMTAMSLRAPVDLRVNTLKTDLDRAEKALRAVRPVRLADVRHGLRLLAPEPERRAGAPDRLPAFSRGWIEVQDLGSQIAAAAVNARPGEQILDYCAGGGGKTLALAAAMQGRGQIHAHDIDMRRLSAIIPRLKRANAHNVQMHPDRSAEPMRQLEAAMDAVLLDAPCSGSGSWRRRPDTKWRLTEAALARRCREQDQILRAAACYVKPEGRLVYVTCSLLPEENEDRIASFLDQDERFERGDAVRALADSALLTETGLERVGACATPEGALLLTPLRIGSDGFFIAVLRRRSGKAEKGQEE